MKIDDATLNHYLIKNLQPLTEADPTLLSDYVAALLKNNKPKKELHKLCIDQLYDFLGEGTKTFVVNLFHALEDGTIPTSPEELESSKQMDAAGAIGSVAEMPPQLERLPNASLRPWNMNGEDEEEEEEEESSDEDRNHKHRRRVSRSRSYDRSDDPESVRYNGRPSGDNERQAGDPGRGPGHPDRDRPAKYDRRLGREHAGVGRFNNGDEGQRGAMRGGPPLRGEGGALRFDGNRMGRGRGTAPWAGPLPPPPFPDASHPLLPPTSGFFPGGRAIPGRGSVWTPGFGPLPVMGSGPLEHTHLLQGGRGSTGMTMGMGMGLGRLRCLDFEERGYCLRGDLCPMEHGANRIVVEDVQSLSKFNLPVALPSGRGMGMGPGPMTTSTAPMLPSSLPTVTRGSRGNWEPSVPAIGEVPSQLNGTVSDEPDLYDPDQLLWNKDRPEASARIRKLPSFQKAAQEQEREGHPSIKSDGRGGEGVGREATNGGLQGPDPGSTVWDRIGPVDRGGSSMEGKPLHKDSLEEPRGRGRGGPWSGRWEREMDSVAPHLRGMPGRGQGGGPWGEAGPPVQRTGDGTSYGPRATGVHGLGAERAQRTLYVSCIPPTTNRAEVLLSHFQKFGHVVDVRIPPRSDRAFVQFACREEAEAALSSSDAVIGNRFIRLSWANRDSIPADNVASTSFAGRPSASEAVGSVALPTSKGREKLGLVTGNGVGTGLTGIPETAAVEGAGKAVTANGSASSMAAPEGNAQKKQEELELMREQIRQKQEALARKRDDFRRKLDKLANQGVGGQAGLSEDQPSKRQKLEDTGDSSARNEGVSAAVTPTTAGLRKSNSGEVSIPAGVLQPSARPAKSPHPRISIASMSSSHTSPASWGPARFKLDNRTSVLRILPPLPAIADIAILREHFAMFGEVSSVEVEDPEGEKLEAARPLTTNSYLLVSFTARRAAERAFVQGRWLQGQTLHLAWAPASAGGRVVDGPGLSNKALSAREAEESNRVDGQALNSVIEGFTPEEDNGGRKDGMRQALPRLAQQQAPVQLTNMSEGASSGNASTVKRLT